MDKNTIYLRRKNKVILRAGKSKVSIKRLATLLKNLESLGYVLSDRLLKRVATLSPTNLNSFYVQLTDDLREMLGANVKYKPMYPNFPTQVMEASEAELYFNAMLHYFGDWIGVRIMPKYKKKRRPKLKDEIKLKVIDLGTEKDFKSIFTNLVAASTSISETDKEDVSWFVQEYGKKVLNMMPESVPLKENVALVASILLENEIDTKEFLSKNVKTATDVLRIAVALSDGDISLAQNTKFRNFKRAERRMLLDVLEGCKNATEDMIRYRERWKRLGEILHPFEKKNRYYRSCKAFSVLYNKEKYQTFASKVEQFIYTFKIKEAIKLLKARPGEYARRLDNLIRLSDNPPSVAKDFASIANKVSTPVLLQVKAHFEGRKGKKSDIRTFFPKGNLAKIQAIENTLQRINPAHCDKVIAACEEALKERFSQKESLGRVYIDDRISGFNVPFAQRSASKTLKSAPRGSRYALPEGNTIRFFIWWKDGRGRTDLDLSMVGMDEDCKERMQVSFTNLKDYGCYHSGDITSAPNGASEFIDVDMQKCISRGVRYAMMNVYSYTIQPYCELPECFAGVMARQKPNSGEIYDPRTVENKMDLTADSTIAIPMIIDLVDRQVIWTDLSLKRNLSTYNTLHGNMSNLQLTVKAMVNLCKPNLHDLFRMHAEARGEIVEDIKDADTIFSMDEGVTPFDADVIISEYMS